MPCLHGVVNQTEPLPSAHRLISRSALARLADVSRAAVTQAARGRLAPARVGERIDLEHPAAIAFLAAHKVETGEIDAAIAREAAQRAQRPDGFRRFVRALRREVVDHPEVLEQLSEVASISDALAAAARAFGAWRQAHEVNDHVSSLSASTEVQ